MVIAAKRCSKISRSSRGQVVSEDLGIDMKNVEISMLGQARQVRISKEETVIVASEDSGQSGR